jgi:hypothetical protein
MAWVVAIFQQTLPTARFWMPNTSGLHFIRMLRYIANPKMLTNVHEIYHWQIWPVLLPPYLNLS